MAVFQLALVFAVRLGLGIPAQIIDDEQVQQAIFVDIQPCTANPPKRSVLLVRLVESRLGGDVGECPVAVVAVEGVMVDAGNEEVLIAVVIVVRRRRLRCRTRILSRPAFSVTSVKFALPSLANKTVVVLGIRLLEAARSRRRW